ncbi:PilZ domain-containing protein [Thiohalorhabdus sp.]|uniref:PilZ domain-containing protein n=1 Tax=Thiohalorhabdus sp. TaxID=3094134 RepID=UPI002FC277C1
MSEPSVRNFSDWLAHLDALVEAAEAGPVDPVIVDYLRTTRERVVVLRERMAEDQRLAPRHETNGEARLVVHGQALSVRIRDRSAGGFGLLAGEPVDSGTYARLDIDGEQAGAIHEGLVSHCQVEGDRYRVGFEVVSSLPIG